MHCIPTTGKYGQNYLLNLKPASTCKQVPLPSTYPYFAPLSRQLMIIPCYCQLPVLPSARGWIKAAQNKALTRNCRPTWISGFFSPCHYSLLNVLFYKEKAIRITRTKPSQHTTQAPVLCVLRLALHATHSIQAVWKQQSKSQIPRDAAVSYLHH